jgi:hypothetical protein
MSGRLALLTLDGRTPEQIEASQVEAQAPYLPNKDKPAMEAQKPVGIFPWAVAFDWLKVFKGKITILSFEWRNK